MTSPAPPDEILAAIREEMREWRQSTLPGALRKRAWHGAVRINGSEFTLYYESPSEMAPDVTLRGRVTAHHEGGSRVVATADLDKSSRITLLVFAVLGLVVALNGGGLTFMLLVVAGLTAFYAWRRQRIKRDSNTEAAYLAERLE